MPGTAERVLQLVLCCVVVAARPDGCEHGCYRKTHRISYGASDTHSSPSSGSVNFDLHDDVMPSHFGAATSNSDFSAQRFGPFGAIQSGTSTYSNSPSTTRSFSGSVRVREGMFTERGGFNGFGRSGPVGDGAASNSYARSGPLEFGAGTFGHASGLGNDRFNDHNGGMLGSTDGLTRSGNGVEHRHSRYVSRFGNGIAEGGEADIGNGGNGAQKATSFVHRSNFEKYMQFDGFGNSGLRSGSLEQSKGGGPGTGSNSESTMHSISNVDRGTGIGTGINGARNRLSLRSGSLVRTRSGGLLGSEPSKELVGLGGGADSNVSTVFVVSETRRNHFGSSTDYGGDSRLSDVSIPAAASGTTGGGKRLRVLESVSGFQSGSLSGSGSNVGADGLENSVGKKQGGSESETESGVFGSGAGALGNSLLIRRTQFGVGGVGDTVTGDGKARLRLLEREEVLSSGHTGPALIINQSSSRNLKRNNVGLGSTTSDIDDGIRGLEGKGNKGFISSSSSSAYSFEGGEMKRSFTSGPTGLTPGRSFSSLESPDNSGFVSASSGSEKISLASSGKGLISDEVSEGPDSNSERLLGDLMNPETVNSLGSSITATTAISGSNTISSRNGNSVRSRYINNSSGSGWGSNGSIGRNSSSSTGTDTYGSTSGAESNKAKSLNRLSSDTSGANTRSSTDLKDSDERVSHFGSRSISNKNQNGSSISSRSAEGARDVGRNSGSGIGPEGKSTGSEVAVTKRIVISSRSSKSQSDGVTFGGSAAALERASAPEDISASVHRPSYHHGDIFSGSGGATENGLRDHVGSFRNVYVVRERSSLQSSFDGEGSSDADSHYGSDGITDGSSPKSDSASNSIIGFRGGSEPEGSPALGGTSKLRDTSSDFRSDDIGNRSRSGSNSEAVGGSVGNSALPGTKRDSESIYGGGSYSYGARYRGDISGTESNDQSSESDSDVSEGSATAPAGSRSTYEARGINDRENAFGSGGEKSQGHAFESSTGNLRKNYRLGRSDGGGESGSVIVFGDGSKIQKAFTNGGFGDTSSSHFGNNYANNVSSEISGSQNMYRRSYVASMAHTQTIGGTAGSSNGLLSNSELGSGGTVLNNAERNFRKGSGTRKGSSTGVFEGSIGGNSDLANYELVGMRDTRSDVIQSQIQRELNGDISASSAESLIGGSPCGSLRSGAGVYGQAGEGCVEGNVGSVVQHQWSTAHFGKERSTGESVNSENIGGSNAAEVRTIRNSALANGLEGSKNFGRKSRLIIGTGKSGIVDDSVVGDGYGTTDLSRRGLAGILSGQFSGIGDSVSGDGVEGDSVHGAELSSSYGGSTLGRESSSNVHNFRNFDDYIRYVNGLRALGEAPAGESEHRTGTSINIREDHGSSSHGGLSTGRVFREINPFSVGGNLVQRVSSSSSFGESTSAGGGENRQPDEFPTNSGSKNRFVVAGFWRSGGIPDCGSGLDGTDVTRNSGFPSSVDNLKGPTVG